MAGCHAESKAALMFMKTQAVYFFKVVFDPGDEVMSCWLSRSIFSESMLAVVEPVVLFLNQFDFFNDFAAVCNFSIEIGGIGE